MGSVNPSSFTGPLILLVLFGWIAYRRTRPQPVGIPRTLIFTAFIVLSSLVGLAANRGIVQTPLFVALAPVMLLVGLGLGWTMMRQIRFWRDEQTGKIWMAGGLAYVAIWLATLALRLGIEYAAGGFSSAASRATDHPTTLAILASDLLFLSVGLWLMRGFILVRRVREHTLLAANEA
jgi:hypothetical protein